MVGSGEDHAGGEGGLGGDSQEGNQTYEAIGDGVSDVHWSFPWSGLVLGSDRDGETGNQGGLGGDCYHGDQAHEAVGDGVGDVHLSGPSGLRFRAAIRPV